ncbi:hypothetical protein CP533_6349 [Ophiocordyceps camponoti-saundersi (nom. inval.)]|nr:hypothetical protein CP533_6349 [Ophiocordyceps camponoti-saundersi (nom. inval.)]
MSGLFQRAKAKLARRQSNNKPVFSPPAMNDEEHHQQRQQRRKSSNSKKHTEKDTSETRHPPSVAPPAYSTHSRASAYERSTFLASSSEDPYHFLYLFDTVFLVDDSSSMCGHRWREVQSALQQLTPVCTSHDDDGIDVYFMNHANSEDESRGYRCIKDGAQVEALFRSVRPFGPTPTRSSIENILDPYIEKLSRAADFQDVRPLNLIVLTDGMPGPSTSYLPEPAIVRYAKWLDEAAAPSYQVGIQFIQVGDDADATRALEILDRLRERYGIRDMVDTTKFESRAGPLSAEGILKAVLGGVDRRLDGD